MNAEKELQAIKIYRSLIRRKRYRVSKLSKYRAELVQLRRVGASYSDLALWLWQRHKMKVQPSSLQRFLKQVPELQESTDGKVPET